MDAFESLFVHFQNFQIIVCRDCKFAVVPDQIKAHLSQSHQTLTVSTRKGIIEQVEKLDHVAYRSEDVVYPAAEQEAIQELGPVIEQCSQCKACGLLRESKKGIEAHCRKEHGWNSAKSRGGRGSLRSRPAANQPFTEGHCCQRFFKYAQWTKLFKVLPPAPRMLGGGHGCEPEDRAQKLTDEVADGLKRKLREAHHHRKVNVSNVRSEMDPWLEHTSWAHHLAGFEKEELRASLSAAPKLEADERGIESVDEEEEAIERACRATGRVIKKAMDVSSPRTIPRSALYYVNRKETGAANNETPFYSKHEASTKKKYSRVWVSMLRYLWRSQTWENKPDYTLTDGQARRLGAMQSLARRETAALDKGARKVCEDELQWSIVLFWASMLDQELLDDEFQSGFLSALAVLGLDTEDAGWVSVFNFTPKLAAIVTVCKALVVFMAYKQRQDDIDRLIGAGIGESEARKEAVSIVEGVHDMVPRLLCLQEYGGPASPMDRVLHMKTFGMRIRFTEKAGARVTWMNRCQQVAIDKISFSMGDLRDALHSLWERCLGRLTKRLMFLQQEEELPILHLDRLFDNPSDLTEGWSFLDDERNDEVLGRVRRPDGKDVESRKWLWSRAMREDRITKYFLQNIDMSEVRDRSELKWNTTKVEQYFREVTLFKEELIVLCHMAGGAPARGTEVVSIRTENGESARAQRGVFVDNGMVELVTGYHKGYSKSGEAKIIHRYLPQEVGKLLVYHLWLVEPFVHMLRWEVRGEFDFSKYLWEPEPEKKWEGEVDGVREEEESGSEEGGRESDGEEGSSGSESESSTSPSSESEADGGDDEGTAGDRMVSGREARSRPRNGGKAKEGKLQALSIDGFWNTERLKRVMKRELSKCQAGFFVTPSTWRQLYPAIQRVHCPEEEVTKQLDRLYEGVTTEDRQMQSGHSKRMEELIYGILTTENPFSTQSEQASFRKVSVSWHHFIRWPSTATGNGKPTIDLEKYRKMVEEERWAKLRRADLNVSLREMLGPNASFRGSQLEGLKAIVSGEPKVVMVMRTGGGKSLMFMLPAFCSVGGVTVVVVPLISLRSDLERRCKEIGLNAGRWPDQSARHARIVLVTPESAVTKAFNRFINDKLATGELDRIVVDESHIVLDSTETWRPKVLELAEFARKGCQMVYLTATLPPKEESSWLEAMGLEKRTVRMIRDSTTRRNIAYQVVEYDRREEEERVAELVRKKLEEHEEGQIIVYCRRVEQCKKIGEVLRCPVYYRRVGDEEMKRKILEQLVKGTHRVFAATTAMGMGVDAPHIRVVVHVGVKELVRDYAQESGRAGRDGEASEAILMRGYNTVGGRKILEKGFVMERGMHEYLEGEKCRRVVLDREMDGRADRIGCENGEKVCDVCRGLTRTGRRARVVVRTGGFVPSQQHRRREQEEADGSGSEPMEQGSEDGTPRGSELGTDNVDDEGESGSGLAEAGDECEEAAKEGRGLKRARSIGEREERERSINEARTGMSREGERVQAQKRSRLAERASRELDRDEMVKRLEDWTKVGCSVCWAQGQIQRAKRARGWEECRGHGKEAGERMAEVKKRMKRLQMARFSGCNFCWVPQSICQRWEEKTAACGSKTAGYQRSGVAGAGCQYKGVMEDIGGAVISQRMWGREEREGKEWEWGWVEGEMERSLGFWEGGGLEEDEWGRLWRWVIRKRVTNMMETNELVRMVYHIS